MTFTDTKCPTGKHKYLTFTHAANDAKAMRRNGKRTTARAFHCRACHKFHTGGDV